MRHAHGNQHPHGVRIGESVGLVCMEREECMGVKGRRLSSEEEEIRYTLDGEKSLTPWMEKRRPNL